MGALNTSVVLGNNPVPLKLTENFFFEVVRQGVTKRKLADGIRDLGFTVSQTEDQSSRCFSHCSNQLRSTRGGFSLLKLAFKKASTTMIDFGF